MDVRRFDHTEAEDFAVQPEKKIVKYNENHENRSLPSVKLRILPVVAYSAVGPVPSAREFVQLRK